MAYPKIAPCPTCNAPGDTLTVYSYDSGGRHVECDKCHYLGPAQGNIRQAIVSHNAKVAAQGCGAS